MAKSASWQPRGRLAARRQSGHWLGPDSLRRSHFRQCRGAVRACLRRRTLRIPICASGGSIGSWWAPVTAGGAGWRSVAAWQPF